jgi:hypothetical protein
MGGPQNAHHTAKGGKGMKSHVELMHDFNTAGAGFLMTELDVASSFIHVAMGAHSFERKQRLLDGARRAFNQALLLRPRFRLTQEEERKFRTDSASIQKALAGFELVPAPDPEVPKAA